MRERERELKARDSRRKQIILRLPESLWKDIARWSDEDFRSINGQIEYLLTRSVREHYKR
ncbi:MAG: Arc family DNA-binding protein [Mogibacterium sp.]|nr:Arc family DNA-binding protein [Mogibacterium sp.]MBR2540486.1 Arc family DNA-binding protein [Mogibacterium sp.]